MCVLRPILNLACNSINNGVYMLASCSAFGHLRNPSEPCPGLGEPSELRLSSYPLYVGDGANLVRKKNKQPRIEDRYHYIYNNKYIDIHTKTAIIRQLRMDVGGFIIFYLLSCRRCIDRSFFL